MNYQLIDVNIAEYKALVSPYEFRNQMPLSERAQETVWRSRRDIEHILDGSERIVIIAGPCSIHDPAAGKDYAERLNALRKRVRDKFEVVMRNYFAKPRTKGGSWKGFLYEPYLDGQEGIKDGLRIARELLIYNAEMGLPSATEFVDNITPQYISDVVSWAAIGARTAESQPHRELASGLSMPVGFKNRTDGDVMTAINAIDFARDPQWFLGIDDYGIPAIVFSKGNKCSHLVLRGGDKAPNYDRDSIMVAQEMLRKNGFNENLVVDCSHGNSGKDYKKQPEVFEELVKQICDGNHGIVGISVESNIDEGNQTVPENGNRLKYGVSITDSCIGWETTERLVLDGYKILSRLGSRV